MKISSTHHVRQKGRGRGKPRKNPAKRGKKSFKRLFRATDYGDYIVYEPTVLKKHPDTVLISDNFHKNERMRIEGRFDSTFVIKKKRR